MDDDKKIGEKSSVKNTDFGADFKESKTATEELEPGMVLTMEPARAEMEKWLDHLQVRKKKREDQKDTIEFLIEAFMYGDLVLNDDFTLTQKFRKPIGEKKRYSEFTYATRLDQGKIRQTVKGVKISEDPTGYIMAYVAALVGEVKAIIDKMDSQDYKIGQNISNFFT